MSNSKKRTLLCILDGWGISKDTKYLILGSFPSVKSLEYGFYYMHSQNRFYSFIWLYLDQVY